MTYGEIIDSLQAYNKKHLEDLKEKAVLDYTLAGLIGRQFGAVFSKEEMKMPTLVEAYNYLFQEEKAVQDEIIAQKEMELCKERMRAFAISHNRKWGERHDP